VADVVPFAAFADHPGEIGPKLRRLAELASWGYRVPDGFAVTGAAATALIERGDRVVRAAIEREHAALCGRLGRERPALAVRSAANAEDGDRRSFAGMFDSVLGVRQPAEIEAGIRTCVASLHGARVAHYRRGGGELSMTVGVQELVPARASGVVFSRHPVTHRADRVVVESVLGLGSAMVDGTAQPDHIEVGRTDLRILGFEVGDKQQRARAVDGGGVTLEPTPDGERRAPSLDAREVEQLCRAAIEIEGRIGRAVDLEWVVTDDGELVIVQARPITSGPREARAPVTWDPLAYTGQRGIRRGD
jgi:pyruvate,water dikinase